MIHAVDSILVPGAYQVRDPVSRAWSPTPCVPLSDV
jgi:hypothetical protein